MKVSWLYMVLLFAGIAIAGCKQHGKYDEGQPVRLGINPLFPDTSQITHLTGEQLATLYCQLCHQFPEPGLLSKRLWQNSVLPQMGLRLGIDTGKKPYQGLSMYDTHIIMQANIFPKEKKITQEKWQQLVDYYLVNAPDSLSANAQRNKTSLNGFQTKSAQLQPNIPALTTLIWFDSLNSQFWLGSRTGKTYLLDSKKLTLIDSIQTNTPIVDIMRTQNAIHMLQIGIMDPADQPLGELVTIDEKHISPVLKELQRPVDVKQADLNDDGVNDFVISNFGNYTGNLTWYNGVAPHMPHTLSDKPGCIKTEICDFNQDSLPDIMALFGQGDERVVIYYNQGKGVFTEKTVLRFPPVYGSSYFELKDFNHDGYLDILYANGDNADYSVELKPYHGVRIFENNGKNEYTEAYFYPTPGATKATAADFDTDGDLDIALISYFADFEHHPEDGFILLDNNAKSTEYAFDAKVLPQVAGRWLTLEIGDYDHDGDQDIALGAFIYNTLNSSGFQPQDWVNTPDVMVLYNDKTIY